MRGRRPAVTRHPDARYGCWLSPSGPPKNPEAIEHRRPECGSAFMEEPPEAGGAVGARAFVGIGLRF